MAKSADQPSPGRPLRGERPRVRMEAWVDPETREAVDGDQRAGERTRGDVLNRWARERETGRD